MSARDQAVVVARAATATLLQLPTDVLDGLSRHGIAVLDLAKAIGNNAAQAIAFAENEPYAFDGGGAAAICRGGAGEVAP